MHKINNKINNDIQKLHQLESDVDQYMKLFKKIARRNPIIYQNISLSLPANIVNQIVQYYCSQRKYQQAFCEGILFRWVNLQKYLKHWTGSYFQQSIKTLQAKLEKHILRDGHIDNYVVRLYINLVNLTLSKNNKCMNKLIKSGIYLSYIIEHGLLNIEQYKLLDEVKAKKLLRYLS